MTWHQGTRQDRRSQAHNSAGIGDSDNRCIALVPVLFASGFFIIAQSLGLGFSALFNQNELGVYDHGNGDGDGDGDATTTASVFTFDWLLASRKAATLSHSQLVHC